ncbi:MAG: hypothetical protein ACOCUA_02945 [archaeon]
MSSEELREQLDNAVKTAVADGTPVDEIDAALQDAQNRLDAIRAYEEGVV